MATVNMRKSRWSPRTAPVTDVSEISGLLRLSNAQLCMSTYITNPHRSHSKSWSTPEYDSAGRRTNTPVQCYRRHLEKERRGLVRELTALMPSYQPPRNYSHPTTFTEQLFMPSKYQYPDVNFIGQILGPRGASLKELQERTGTTIRIRGEGSVKEGKERQVKVRKVASSYRPDRTNNALQHQPLHVLITGDEPSKVTNAKDFIQKIFADAISKPEWQNERKLKQIRDLAIVNGTFRDDEGFGRHGRSASDQLTAPGVIPTGDDNIAAVKPPLIRCQATNSLPPWRKRPWEATQELTSTEIDLEVDQWLRDLCCGST